MLEKCNQVARNCECEVECAKSWYKTGPVFVYIPVGLLETDVLSFVHIPKEALAAGW